MTGRPDMRLEEPFWLQMHRQRAAARTWWNMALWIVGMIVAVGALYALGHWRS